MARTCALNALAAIDSVVGIDNVTRVVKVVGFVASAPGFTRAAGRRERCIGTSGRSVRRGGVHARSAVGVSELLLDAPVEVELIVEVADSSRLRVLCGRSSIPEWF